jgi:hypothetical protein
VNSPGFAPVKRDGVTVGADGRVELTLKLKIAVLPENVEVAPDDSLTTNAADNKSAPTSGGWPSFQTTTRPFSSN